MESIQNIIEVVMEKLSIFKDNRGLDDIKQRYLIDLDKNKPIEHIQFIIQSKFNSFDVFNKPDAPKDQFLDAEDEIELKNLNERYIKIKRELDEYIKTMKEKYNNDLDEFKENEVLERDEFVEKFGEKCYELRKDQAFHTFGIIYKFIQKNNVKI